MPNPYTGVNSPMETNESAYVNGRPFANPYFVREDGSTYIATSRQVEIHKHEYRHEIAIVYLEATKSTLAEICLGSPAFIHYGRLPNRFAQFYGYVYGVEPKRARENQRNVKKGAIPSTPEVAVFLIGATWRLKDPAPKVWRNLTTKQILHEICRNNYFDLVVAEEDFGANHLWTEIVQPSDVSTWEFMVDLCKKSGLVIYPEQTTLYVHPRHLVPRSGKANAPFFYDNYVKDFKAEHSNDFPGNDNNSATVVADVSTDGQAIGGNNVRPTNVQIDPLKLLCRQLRREVSPYQQQASAEHAAMLRSGNMQPPTRRFIRPSYPMGNYADIAFAVRAEEHLKAWPTTALTHVKGHAMVRAGEVVRMEPNRQYPDPHRGYWYVMSAWHVVVPGDYYVRMELGNNNAAPVLEEEEPNTPSPVDPPRIPEGEDPVIPTPGRPAYTPYINRPVNNPPVLSNPTTPGIVVMIPEEPDPPISGVPVVTPAPSPEPARFLGGPTCPVQPRPFLAQEWRASWIGPLDYNLIARDKEELVGL